MKKLIIFESILILFFVLAWNVSKAEKYFEVYGDWNLIGEKDPFTDEGWGKLLIRDTRGESPALNSLTFYFNKSHSPFIDYIRFSTIDKFCPYGGSEYIEGKVRIDNNEVIETKLKLFEDALWFPLELKDKIIQEMFLGDTMYLRIFNATSCKELFALKGEITLKFNLAFFNEAYSKGINILGYEK